MYYSCQTKSRKVIIQDYSGWNALLSSYENVHKKNIYQPENCSHNFPADCAHLKFLFPLKVLRCNVIYCSFNLSSKSETQVSSLVTLCDRKSSSAVGYQCKISVAIIFLVCEFVDQHKWHSVNTRSGNRQALHSLSLNCIY